MGAVVTSIGQTLVQFEQAMKGTKIQSLLDRLVGVELEGCVLDICVHVRAIIGLDFLQTAVFVGAKSTVLPRVGHSGGLKSPAFSFSAKF